MPKNSKLISGEYPSTPRVAVGAVVFHQGKVLLVKRGKPPSEGHWAIPGGGVKLGESLQEAAEREIKEETGVTIKAHDPAYTFDVVEKDATGKVRFHYVIIDLWAHYLAGQPFAGDDAHGARWVSPRDLARMSVSPQTRELLKTYPTFTPPPGAVASGEDQDG